MQTNDANKTQTSNVYKSDSYDRTSPSNAQAR